MCRLVQILTLSSFLTIVYCQQIDLNICPNGLTLEPPDPKWPRIIPNRFEIFTEITTDVETFEVLQLFSGPFRDAIYFRNFEDNFQTHYDYETNEILTFNQNAQCERTEISSKEYSPFVASQIVKPSIVLGFDGRNNYNDAFFTRYIGQELIRDGILTKKFQSCFYLAQENITINATYYLADSPPNQTNMNSTVLDFIQIDVRSNNFPYTFNIIRYEFNPSINIATPVNGYCPDRINRKELPHNLPARLSVHAEAYTLKTINSKSRIESFDRFIDENIEIEGIDYSSSKILEPMAPDRVLIDYISNLSYVYIRDTQQCTVVNANVQSMGTTNNLFLQFGFLNQSIQYQYTGLVKCGRENLRCHRWIGQRDFPTSIQQYEWYWSAQYNNVDLEEFIPIKLNIRTIHKNQPLLPLIDQEMHFYNYNLRPDPLEAIDTVLGECYRALGPSNNFNYAVVRMTLNNDAKYPVHQYLLSLRNRLHYQLANDLRVRHVRLSSFVIDTTRDTTDHQDKDVYVTFTILDNPPALSNIHNEPASLELIRRLAKHINDGNFYVRDNDGAYDLQARPFSLQTLVLYLLPSENHTSYFNETIFIYHNITQTVIKPRPEVINKNTGPTIAALWTGFTLLGVIVAIAVGSFIAIKRWTIITSS